ncbi:MAG: hypothetical protein AAF705_06600, partial [Bacteroidota bacterium]
MKSIIKLFLTIGTMILPHLIFIPTIYGQELRGTIITKDFFIDTDARKVDDYYLSSKRFSNDTTYYEKKVCGDTVFWDASIGSETRSKFKSVQFGDRVYMKFTSKNYYVPFNTGPNIEATIKAKDWKKTRGKIKKLGLDYYFTSPGRRNVKIYATVDTTH